MSAGIAALIALLWLPAELPAQLVLRIESGGIGAHLGALSAVAANGRDLSNGVHLEPVGFGGAARFDLAPRSDPTAGEFVHAVVADAWQAVTSRSGGALRHEFDLARPVMGRLVVEWQTVTSGTGASAFTLDLGADGSIEVDDGMGVGSVALPVALPAGVTRLAIALSASAVAGTIQGPWGIQIDYQGAATAELRVRLEPTHGTVTQFAGGCAGAGTPGLAIPATTIVGNFDGAVSVLVAPDGVHDVAIVALGLAPTSLPLPVPPFCVLEVDPLITSWQPLDGVAGAAFHLALPVGAPAIGFATQVVGLDLGTGAPGGLSAATSAAHYVLLP